jgi:uncharacterized DUF497 family protein
MHNNVLDVEFDPSKSDANLRKHGVRFSDAVLVLHDPLAITVDDPDAVGEQRMVTLGMDAFGRLLVVVHTQRGERTRLISARKASSGEAAQYHAKGIRL